jgi:hypothetical protein
MFRKVPLEAIRPPNHPTTAEILERALSQTDAIAEGLARSAPSSD